MTRRSLLFLGLAALLALAPAGGLAGVPKPATSPGKPGAPDKKSELRPGHIKVLIPAAARLAIDDNETRATGAERRFTTPPLAPGRTASYTLTAVWEEGSRRIKRMAVAKVRPGEETVVDLRPNSQDASSSQVIYVPTPQKVVDKMLELAKVTKDDLVYDLGCGDGRVLVTAAKKYGARGVGIDIDPRRVQEALANVRKAGVEKLVEIRQGDALKVPDLARATVVTTYMLPEFMEKLRPVLREELRPGTRIVAHDYAIPAWPPQQTVTVPAPSRIYAHTLFLWTVPAPKKK
jgi:uncharacterized protein (TIGR03000 family)